MFHCTVGEMRAKLGADEFTQWYVYFTRKAQRQQLAQQSAEQRR